MWLVKSNIVLGEETFQGPNPSHNKEDRTACCLWSTKSGNSLTMQWLGLCASTARARVLFLVRELRFCKPHDVTKKTKWKKNFFSNHKVSLCIWFRGPLAAAAAKLHQLCPTLCDPIVGSPPGFPSLGFSRQEHWSGLPFPSPMHESEKCK